MKYTREMAERSEIENLCDALGNCIELSNEFLSSSCGEEVATLLRQIPEHSREYIIQDCLKDGDAYFIGCAPSRRGDHIFLAVYELEIQFEGTPEEYFEEPEDWYIRDGEDLAYLNVGYGLSIPVNLIKLEESVKEYLTANKG